MASGTTLITAAIIVVALLAAVVKPWGEPAPGPTTSPIAVAAAPTPSTAAASASLSPFDGPFGLVCYGGLEWRLVLRETNGTSAVRTWYDMATVAADGPADASIPFLRVHSEGVLSLGYCTNSDTSDLLSVAGTTVWKLTPGGLPCPSDRCGLSADSPVDPDIGSLFTPPRAADGSSRPPGRPAATCSRSPTRDRSPSRPGSGSTSSRSTRSTMPSETAVRGAATPRPRRLRRTERGHSWRRHTSTSVTPSCGEPAVRPLT